VDLGWYLLRLPFRGSFEGQDHLNEIPPSPFTVPIDLTKAYSYSYNDLHVKTTLVLLFYIGSMLPITFITLTPHPPPFSIKTTPKTSFPLSNKTPHHHPNILNSTLPTNPTPPYLIFHPPNPPQAFKNKVKEVGTSNPPPRNIKFNQSLFPKYLERDTQAKGHHVRKNF
jgi:hypothetical protein